MDRKWWTLVAVCVATFMLLLDVTIVNVALPDIERDLNVELHRPAVGRRRLRADARGAAADRRLARRPASGAGAVFVIGLGIFTVASLLCGLATSPTVLNLSRALQGVGGAFMFATSLALLAHAFQGRDRGTAFGVWGATTGAAVAVGPLVGGVLDRRHSAGSAIFFVNVPIGIAAIALDAGQVAESQGPERRRGSTGPGTVTFSGALFLLVFGLIRGNAEGWSSGDRRLLVGAAVLLARVRRRSSCRTTQPMLDLTLFRKPAFVGAVDRRLRALGVDVRDVPLPHALHPEHPRLLAARRPACASCR